MSTLISELKQKATGQVEMPILKHDKNGHAYYSTLPPNTQQATINDFTDHGNGYVNGRAYLIHTELTGIYEAHRSQPGFTQANDFFTFLEKGRIYVFT